ncbi:MAG: hypothetical protein AAF654_14850 [Myxococcota bacterium]
MTRLLAALTLGLVACGPKPVAITVPLEGSSASPAAAGILVVVRPYDDRFDGERSGESKTATFTFAFPGFGYGTHRGNYVTGDDRFTTFPGDFGAETVGNAVGNVLLAAFDRSRLAERVVADTAAVRWRCTDGTCGPSPRDIREIAARTGARFVVAPRIAHFFGTQFGESTAWSAAYQERVGNTVYNVSESYRAETSAGSAGSATIELSIFTIADGAIVDTQRRSFSGTGSRAGGVGDEAKEAAARAAIDGLGDAVSRVVEGLRSALIGD